MAANSSPKVLRRVSWYCSSVSSGIRPLAVKDQEYGRQPQMGNPKIDV
jgi:hypothetical protein